MGLNVPALRVLAYSISSFLGGVGGAIFVAIAQSIYPFELHRRRQRQLHAELLSRRPWLSCSARCSARSCSISAGICCSRPAQYQLLIYSGVLIVLMLALPNGLLSLRRPQRGGGAEPMAPILSKSPASPSNTAD